MTDLETLQNAAAREPTREELIAQLRDLEFRFMERGQLLLETEAELRTLREADRRKKNVPPSSGDRRE